MENDVNIEIAKTLMQAIMYDNGAVDRWHPEKYPEKWIKKIAPIAGYFFQKNPSILTNENIENICCGFIEENIELYGKLEGYSELSKVLNEYFDHI